MNDPYIDPDLRREILHLVELAALEHLDAVAALLAIRRLLDHDPGEPTP